MAMTVDIISTPAISSQLSGGSKTMSSREIAELTGSSHDNVLKTVRALVKKGVISGNETPYTHPQNGQTYTEFLLDYRDTMVAVSGYSPELRAKIIDRWLDLEKGMAVTATPKRSRKPAFDTTYTRLLKIARTLPGFDENQQCLHAARGTFNMTGVNPLEIMGVTSIAAPNNDAYLTATEIGKEIGLSAMAVNKLLIAEGYQVKVQASSSGSDYQVTEKGAPFGRMFDTTRKGGKGSQATLKWSNRIVKHLLPFSRPKEAAS